VTDRTRASLAVDYVGRLRRLDELGRIALRHGLRIIEAAGTPTGLPAKAGRRMVRRHHVLQFRTGSR
jgi:dTDP-4-amino-4,6-dideoxygalactose transaminase